MIGPVGDRIHFLDWEEIVVADLMRLGNMQLEQVLTAGYYKMHRLWSMLTERRANDLMMITRAIDLQTADANSRTEFWNTMKVLQPRSFPAQEIPDEVMKVLTEAFGPPEGADG